MGKEGKIVLVRSCSLPRGLVESIADPIESRVISQPYRPDRFISQLYPKRLPNEAVIEELNVFSPLTPVVEFKAYSVQMMADMGGIIA